jgi:teichuronic acid biosynthesis glycosyltransferase TuaH
VAADTRLLVWISPTPWDSIPGTDRPIVTEMTRHARILWVDPPLSVVSPARLRGEGGGAIVPSLSAVGDRITRLSTVALPGLTRPGVRITTAPLLRAQIRWALRRLGARPSAVVAGYLEDVLGRWDGAVNALYVTDDHVAGAGLMGLSADRLEAQERRALSRADVVAAVSPVLADRLSAMGANPVLIPNGCQVTGGPPQAAAAAAADLPGPVVGLIGHLSERIDLNILTALSDAGYSLLVVGPHDSRWEPQRFAALTSRPNVVYTGRVPADTVPSYLAAIDIGITPYADSAFNQASFPLKTLEYLSAGRPVVSTDLPGSRWLLDDLVSAEPAADQVLALASTPADVVAAVRRLAGNPGDPAQPRPLAATAGAESARSDLCRMLAARHSWARRADAMAAAIGLTPAQDDHRAPFVPARGSQAAARAGHGAAAEAGR